MMSAWQSVKHELRAIALVGLYFLIWIGGLLLLKALVLAQYEIAFHEWSLALVGALVLAKVVLILEHVPLGRWTRGRPAWVAVALRTALYSLGVLVVLLIERAFEGRHEHGGFGPALAAIFQDAEAPHVWANTICLAGALLFYNLLSVLRQNLGEGGLARVFLSPLPERERAEARTEVA